MPSKQDVPLKEKTVQQLQQEIRQLKEKCDFLESVVHQVPANIYVSDLEDGVVWCNKTNEETLGYKLDEIRKFSLMEYMEKIVHPDDFNIPEESLEHYRHFDGPEYGGVFRAKHKDDNQFKWFIGWARAFQKKQDGAVKQILCVDVDMSHQMNTEKQLITALKENLTRKNKLLIENLRTREVEILNLICKGMRTKAIATKLFISINTVSTHRRNIQKKLGTSNLADLVSLAKEAGLG
jgi:PAS domain S-box-containing protein